MDNEPNETMNKEVTDAGFKVSLLSQHQKIFTQTT
jgi:hypothetical protein